MSDTSQPHNFMKVFVENIRGKLFAFSIKPLLMGINKMIGLNQTECNLVCLDQL